MPTVAMYVLVAGNPGVGKSAICNSMGANFRSGVSVGYGMTAKAQQHEVVVGRDVCTLIDTPGLYDADLETTRRNAEEITSGLCKGREYVVVFLITLRSGRVMEQDVETMRAVTESAKLSEEQVAIIVNKVDRETLAALKENEGALRAVINRAGIRYKCMATIELFGCIDSYSKTQMKRAMLVVLGRTITRHVDTPGSISLSCDKVQNAQLAIDRLGQRTEMLRREREEIERRYDAMRRKCSDSLCSSRKTPNSEYCGHHQCVVCYDGKGSNSDYCYAHQCAACYNGKTSYSHYCNYHQCADCYDGRAPGSRYCYNHKICSIM